jgi:hypothetical protein
VSAETTKFSNQPITNTFITNKVISNKIIIFIPMKNQFAFGQVVTGEFFTNRATEKEQLRNNFLNGIHTIIIAPRRYGKTSLVEEVAGTLNAAGEIR